MNEILLNYMRGSYIDDNMIWKDRADEQMIFMRDDIALRLLGVPVFHIGTHRSKSIELPVYGFVMRNGTAVIARDNFHNIKVSVVPPKALPKKCLPLDLITDGLSSDIHDCYLEGFKKEWAYGRYEPGKKGGFTVEVYEKYDFYVLMYCIGGAFGDMKIPEARRKRSVASIAESISKIYRANKVGFPLTERMKAEGITGNYTDGFEVLHGTYRKAETAMRLADDQRGVMNISADPSGFAELILKYKDAGVLDTFLFEEYAFNYGF